MKINKNLIEIRHIENIPDEYIKKAESENLIFSDGTKYIGLFYMENLICFSGYKNKKNFYLLKNSYTLPEYRKQGLFTKLHKYKLSFLKDKKIVANVTKMALNIHLKECAEIIKKFKNGIYKIEYRRIEYGQQTLGI